MKSITMLMTSILACFKPYKGVSSNSFTFMSALNAYLCFKPYKGVSSNESREPKPYLIDGFQTL